MRTGRMLRGALWALFIVASVCLLVRLNHRLQPEAESPQQQLHQQQQQHQQEQQRSLTTSAQPEGISTLCHTVGCIRQFELVLSRSNSSADRVPRVRHILWKSESVPGYFARQLRSWHEVQPNWTYVLWRDSDMDKFVAKRYTGALSKFRSLGKAIMRVDMIRYMILHQFGGVYADLDYVLLRPLDRFLELPAVVSRETEAHALFHFGMRDFPPRVLPNPAFMMSQPGHPFFHYALLQLTCRNAGTQVLNFAGPLGLADIVAQYAKEFPIAEDPLGAVVVPPSRNFYAFEGNNLASSASSYKAYIVSKLRSMCSGARAASAELTAYCKDVANLDPITDRRELAYAVHDYNKSHSSYDPAGSKEFEGSRVDIRTVLPRVLMADTMF